VTRNQALTSHARMRVYTPVTDRSLTISRLHATALLFGAVVWRKNSGSKREQVEPFVTRYRNVSMYF